jgi:hypothetical protein
MMLERSLRNEMDDMAAIDGAFGVLADAEWPERRAGNREKHLAGMWAAGS